MLNGKTKCESNSKPTGEGPAGSNLRAHVDESETTNAAYTVPGIKIVENWDGCLFISGSKNADEALEAARWYTDAVNIADLDDMRINMFTVTPDRTDPVRGGERGRVTIFRVPEGMNETERHALMTYEAA